MPSQVVAQTVSQRVGADEELELPHHDRRLLIDDGAVQRPRLAEVGERLPDRVGAGRAIDGVGGGVIVEQEPQIVVDRRKRRVDDLRRHEIREHFFHPDIVEPAHRDEIAEPHVGGLVCNRAGAVEDLRLSGRSIEEQAVRVVEDGPGMLHPAELERRNHHDVELAERVRDAGVLLHPVESGGVQIEDGVAVVRDLLRVVLAVKHAELATAALRALDREPAGREGEQVRGDGLRFGETNPSPSIVPLADARLLVADGLPSLGHLERQGPPGLEVRLIEAGERFVRPSRHEDRVQDIVAAVERHVSRVERDRDPVLSPPQDRCRKHQMAVHGARLRGGAVDGDRVDRVRPMRVEIDRERHRRAGEIERDRFATGDRRLTIGGDRERDVVPEARNARRTVAGERFAGSRLRVDRRTHSLDRRPSTDRCH